MKHSRPAPDGLRPEFGNLQHLNHVVLGPIPRFCGLPYGASLLRRPSQRQLRRRISRVAPRPVRLPAMPDLADAA